LTKKLELAHDYDALIKALADEIQIVTGYNTAWVYLIGDTPNIAHLLMAQENVGITDKLPSLDINNIIPQEIQTVKNSFLFLSCYD